MMKISKLQDGQEEEEEEGPTLDVMETQYEDVQGKENKEDVATPIETVVE